MRAPRTPSPGAVAGARAALGDAGKPLDTAQRARMQVRLAHDFGDVRVHDGPRVRTAARALGATGFTVGRDVALATAPGASAPDGLVAHELAHVVQQRAPGGLGADGAERQARAAATGPAAVSAGAGVGLACSVDDWLLGTPHYTDWGYTRLVEELQELTEWLDRQTTSSPEETRVREAQGELQAELRKRDRALTRPPKRPRRRKKKGAAAETPGEPMEMPRILREKTSTAITDPVELRHEVDLITAWLQRPDVSRDDRELLRGELANLAPGLNADLGQRAGERRAGRLAKALAPSGDTGRAQAIEAARRVDSIAPLPDRPGFEYLMDGSEMIVIPAEQAGQIRAQIRAGMESAARRTRFMNEATDDRWEAHRKLNYEEHPVVGFVVSVFSGEDPVDLLNRIQPPLSESHTALVNYRVRAKSNRPLAEQAAAVFDAAEHGDRARRILSAGIDKSINVAENIATGLEITRDLAFVVVLSAAAIAAAPVVAAGVAGLGATGGTALVLTAAGTGGVVGTGGAVLRGGSAAAGTLAAGGSLAEAGEALKTEGKVGAIQGFTIGAGGGATRHLASALGVGRAGLSQASNLGRSALAGGGGNAIGSGAGAVVSGQDAEGVVKSTVLGGGLGVLGGASGSVAKGLTNPVAKTAVGLGVPAAAAGGVTYAQTGDVGKALQASGEVVVSAALVGRAAKPTAPTRTEQAANRAGTRVRKAGSALAKPVVRGARIAATGAMLGLAQVPALRTVGGGGIGSTPALVTGRPAVTTTPSAVQPAAVQPAAIQPAAVQPAAVQPAAVQPAAVQPAAVQPAASATAAAATASPTPALATAGVVAQAPEVSAGFAAQHVGPLGRLLGRPLSDAAISRLRTVWDAAANPGENLTLTAANSRSRFNNHRGRFWRAVRNDPQAMQLLTDAGLVFGPGLTSAPFYPLPGGGRYRISIDHVVERQTDPTRALDATNLRLSSLRENTVLLRLIHQMDPFQ